MRMNKWEVERKLFNLIALLKILEMNKVEKVDSPEHIRAVQKRRLQKIVSAAYREDFYKSRFDDAGIDPESISSAEDLLLLPPLRKEEYRDFVARKVETNPDKYRSCWKDHTSGSTGMPLTVYFTPEEYAYKMAKLLLTFSRNGHQLFLGKTFTVASPTHGEGGARTALSRFGILQKESVSQLADPSDMVSAFNQFMPDLFYANKSQIVQMMNYAEETGIPLYKPRLVSTGSETWDSASYRQMSLHFGRDALVARYGCIELGEMAYTKKGNPNIYYPFWSTDLINVVDEDKWAISETGCVYVTSLYQSEFPIINYRVGDQADAVYGPEGLKYLTAVRGRADDWLIFADGTKLPFHFIYEAMSANASCKQFKAIQESYSELTVQVVPNVVGDQFDEEYERNVIVSSINNLLPEKKKMIIKVDWCERIPVEPNGKIRMLVSKVAK